MMPEIVSEPVSLNVPLFVIVVAESCASDEITVPLFVKSSTTETALSATFSVFEALTVSVFTLTLASRTRSLFPSPVAMKIEFLPVL